MKRNLILLVVMLLAGLVVSSEAAAKKILIYGPALAPSSTFSNTEATIAEDLGYEVTIKSAGQWGNMTTAQFASYNAIVFPDNGCPKGGPGVEVFAAANQNKAKWSAAITGPMVLYASDPVFHAEFCCGDPADKIQLIKNALQYAAGGATTGLYVCFSCLIENPPGKLAFLSKIGKFELTSQSSDNIHIQKPNHPLAAGLTDSEVSNWSETSHSFFTQHPRYFQVIIIRRDQSGGGGDEKAPAGEGGGGGHLNHYMMIAADHRQ
jgi:hypothetical protein